MFATKRRCRVCGNGQWVEQGEKAPPCPFTFMHEKALRGLGQPPGNTSQAAVKLRTLAVEFTKHKAAEYGDPNDKAGQRLNRKLLAAARAYGRVAAHAEAVIKQVESHRGR